MGTRTCNCSYKQKNAYVKLMETFSSPIYKMSDAMPVPNIPPEGINIVEDQTYKDLGDQLRDAFSSAPVGTNAEYYEA